MGPKSTLRLMRTLRPSLSSLAQSSWSLLSNSLKGVGLNHPFSLEKDLTSNPEVLETLGFFLQHL